MGTTNSSFHGEKKNGYTRIITSTEKNSSKCPCMSYKEKEEE